MLPITQVKVMTGVGAILVLLCAVFIGVFPVIFSSIVEKMLVVRADSDTFEAFVTPPIPIYMQFWLFNVTNPEDIQHRGAKPHLTEVGPYTYEEVRVKYDFDWTTDGQVSYLQNKSYVFREDMSNGLKEDDFITSINVLMVIASRLLNNENNNNNNNINNLIPGMVWTQLEASMDLFETHTAGETLFYGYQLPEFNFDFSGLSMIDWRLNATAGMSGTLLEILGKLGLEDEDLPGQILENSVGLLYGVNNTNDKQYTIKTGSKGMGDFMNIVSWNNSSLLEYWTGPGSEYCNMINGTDGSQYPPGLTRDSVLMIYTSELCRSIYLTYEMDTHTLGVPVYRFTPPREVLEDPLVNHDNLCYCYPDTQHCLPAGMLSLEPCLKLPMVLSTPHFYNGDPKEVKKFVGLNPRKRDHETTIDVEPRTGVAMYAAKKMQLNIPLQPYGGLPSFKNVPKVIFPILWVNESARIDEETAKAVKGAVSVPFIIVNSICGTLIGIGVILLLVSLVKYLHIKRSRQDKL